MSTWAGVFQSAGNVEPVLRRMREVLRQRPADGEWQWSNERFGLICRPLLIHEPHCDPTTPARDRDVVIAFDGRLDNRVALARSLQLAQSATDSALVLACYRRLGESCVGQLEGDFGFALADAERELLLVARDAVGIRPIYYTATPHGYYCASSVRALLQAVVPAPEPDLDALTRLLSCPQTLASTETFVAGVHALPPAYALIANRAGQRLWKYWEADGSSYHGLSHVDCLETFRSLFQQSVQRRLRGVARAAVQVSGGVDSSSILCVAQEAETNVLGLYHGGSSGGADDETAYLGSLEAAGMTIERVPLLPAGYPELTSESIEHSEFPLLDEFPAAALRVAERARELSVRLLLNGGWADQVLFPFPPGYLVDAFRGFRWITVVRHLLSYPAWFSDVPRQLVWGTALRALVRAHLPDSLLQRRARSRPPDAIARLLHPDRRRAALAEDAPIERWSSLPSEHARALISRVRARANTMGMEWSVKAASAQGMDIAFPYLDRDLITLLVNAPPLAQMPDGIPKGLLRKSLREFVPERVLQRRDKGEYSDVGNVGMRSGAERSFAELRDGHALRAGLLDETLFPGDLAKLSRLVKIPDAELYTALAKLFCIECWLRRFAVPGGSRVERTMT